GSCVTGGGLPGSGVHSPPTDTHPTLGAEKSGGLCCARSGGAAAHMRPAKRPAASEYPGLFPVCSDMAISRGINPETTYDLDVAECTARRIGCEILLRAA